MAQVGIEPTTFAFLCRRMFYKHNTLTNWVTRPVCFKFWNFEYRYWTYKNYFVFLIVLSNEVMTYTFDRSMFLLKFLDFFVNGITSQRWVRHWLVTHIHFCWNNWWSDFDACHSIHENDGADSWRSNKVIFFFSNLISSFSVQSLLL